MDESNLDLVWRRIVELPPIWMILWLGLALLTVLLLILTRTRWGQSRPLHKCAVLSLLAHVLLGGFATTIQIVTGAAGSSDNRPIHVSITEGLDESEPADATKRASKPQPWAPRTMGEVVEPDLTALDRTPPEMAPLERTKTNTGREIPTELLSAASTPPDSDFAELPEDAPSLDPRSQNKDRTVAEAKPIETKPAERETSDPLEKLLAMPEVKRTATTPLPTHSSVPDRTLPSEDIPMPSAPPVTSVAQSDPDSVPDDNSTAESASQIRQAESKREASPVSSAIVSNAASQDAARNMTAVNSDTNNKKAKEASFKGENQGEIASGKKRPLPGTYRARVGADRDRLLEQNGGNGKTEAAVRSALKWLASAQNQDGRWDANRHGAGREQVVLGEDRQGAGAKADTAVTALALLAYLGAGHTHLEGDYRDTVRRGLEFLLRSQKNNGQLAGDSNQFAQMYCHAMAAFALSEAYAMTNDVRLKPAVEAAVRYSVETQHPTGGSWRYKHWHNHRYDPGDTSLLGWQVMVLKSAERAGVEVRPETWNGVRRFLQSVSSTRYPGRASYRPGSGPSRVMTAEALFCRQLTEPQITRPADNKSIAYLLEDMPGGGKPNLYYWYYATLSMVQHQGPAWRKWNNALTQALLSRQQATGDLAGSWNPDTMWGGYGGRVYSTAMSAMCLEVYYRYAPADRTAQRPLIIR